MRSVRTCHVMSMSFNQSAPLEALCNPQNDGAISDKQQLVLSKIAFAGAPAVVRCEVWIPKTTKITLLSKTWTACNYVMGACWKTKPVRYSRMSHNSGNSMPGEAGMLRRQTKQQWNKTVRTVVTVDFLYKIVEEFHFKSVFLPLIIIKVADVGSWTCSQLGKMGIS